LQIGINPILVQKYFSGIDVSNRLTVNVNPAFLAIYKADKDDILS
jgi:glutathione synthase/RimK-type ligase-like ATP-grasp enzyme